MNEHSPEDSTSTFGFFSKARKTRKQFLKLRFGWITWNEWPSSIYRLIASLSDYSQGFIHPWLAGYLPSTVGICIPITSYKDDPPSEAKHLPWTNVTAKSCCYRVMLHAAEGVGRAMAGSKAGWFHPQMVKDQGNPNPTMSERIQVLELYIYIFKSNLARFLGGIKKNPGCVFFRWLFLKMDSTMATHNHNQANCLR